MTRRKAPLLGFKEQGFGRQRTIVKGLLLSGSPRLYIVMHAAEQHVDLEPRLTEMLKQALGKRAIQPIAVLVNLSVLGGVGERILAAGIKNDEAELSPG
jgi:hypothetical protein